MMRQKGLFYLFCRVFLLMNSVWFNKWKKNVLCSLLVISCCRSREFGINLLECLPELGWGVEE